MQARVRVDTAREFATIFYRDLLRHGTIDRAANSARSSLMTSKVGGSSVPVDYMRMEDGLLFDRAAPAPVQALIPAPTPVLTPSPLPTPPPPPTPGKSSWFRYALYAVGLLIVLQLLHVGYTSFATSLPSIEYSIEIAEDSGGQPAATHHILAKDEVLQPGSFFAHNVKALQSGHFYLWQSCLEDNKESSLTLTFPLQPILHASIKTRPCEYRLDRTSFRSSPNVMAM